MKTKVYSLYIRQKPVGLIVRWVEAPSLNAIWHMASFYGFNFIPEYTRMIETENVKLGNKLCATDSIDCTINEIGVVVDERPGMIPAHEWAYEWTYTLARKLTA